MTEGILIIDNSSLKHIESQESRSRLTASLRAAAWKAWPTAVNYLEAAKNQNPSTRDRTLGTLRWLCGKGGLLPWPHEILRITGQAILENRPKFEIEWSGMEAHLFRGEITDEHRVGAEEFIDSQQAVFDAVQEKARRAIQAALKEFNTGEFSAERFLEEVWHSAAHLDVHLQLLWESFDFPGDAPVNLLRQLEPWMLFFDVYGVVAYEQAFLKERRTRVQLPDLLQLLYLGVRKGKRAVATEDKAFTRAGNAILRRRYPRAEVTSINDFLQ